MEPTLGAPAHLDFSMSEELVARAPAELCKETHMSEPDFPCFPDVGTVVTRTPGEASKRRRSVLKPCDFHSRLRPWSCSKARGNPPPRRPLGCWRGCWRGICCGDRMLRRVGFAGKLCTQKALQISSAFAPPELPIHLTLHQSPQKGLVIYG